MVLNYISGWEQYAALDAMVAIFAGQHPPESSGMGLLLIDEEQPGGGRSRRPVVEDRGSHGGRWGRGRRRAG
jgi:hypothetical protein